MLEYPRLTNNHRLLAEPLWIRLYAPRAGDLLPTVSHALARTQRFWTRLVAHAGDGEGSAALERGAPGTVRGSGDPQRPARPAVGLRVVPGWHPGGEGA